MRSFGIGVVMLVLAAPSGPVPAQPDAPAAIPDHELSLARGSVFEVQAPPAVEENTSDPGERPLPGRSHPEMPPAVPHGVADFLPITRADNLCVDCHGVETKEPGEPTPIPASHYLDDRRAPGVVAEALPGARWVCTSCHVAQTAAGPLVANPFLPTLASPEEPRKNPPPGEPDGGSESRDGNGP